MGFFDFFKNKSKGREPKPIRPLAYLPNERREWSGQYFSYWLPETFFEARAGLLERAKADSKNFWASIVPEQDTKGRMRIGVYVDGVRIGNVTHTELDSPDGQQIAAIVLQNGVNVAVVGLRGHRGARTLNLATGKITKDANQLTSVEAVLNFGDFPYKPRIW